MMIWSFGQSGTNDILESVKYFEDNNYESVNISNRGENRVALRFVMKGM